MKSLVMLLVMSLVMSLVMPTPKGERAYGGSCRTEKSHVAMISGGSLRAKAGHTKWALRVRRVNDVFELIVAMCCYIFTRLFELRT